MSFGFGVGDCIAVYELASRVRKKFVDAPDQFKDIKDEVGSLQIVLQDIEVVLDQHELSSQQTAELRSIVKACENVLEKLTNTLGKHQEIDSHPKTLSGKTRRIWKRLKVEPEDIREARSRISSNIALLNTFLGNFTTQVVLATNAKVDRLDRHQDDKENQAIADWLTPVDYSTQQSDFNARQVVGSGQWLLETPEFKVWLNQIKRTLFCPGIPGAGKTMLTSIVVKHLEMQFDQAGNTGIAYLYCNFRRGEEQRFIDLLMSLLKQLIQGQTSLPKSVKILYEYHEKKRTRPLLGEVSSVLHSVIGKYARTFIIIDALDECQNSDGTRKKLLSEIFKLQMKNNVSFFATSRFIPEIVDEFQGSPSVEIRASEEDVRRYLAEHMPRLPRCVTRSQSLQEEIATAITGAVDGMFLLAQLHLDSLVDKLTPRAVKRALATLPNGTHALDQAYQDAMERILAQKTGFRELAILVLSWITCARRRLTSLELRHALAVEAGNSVLDEDNVPEIAEAVSVCAGLVTVEKESDIVRLVHYTTQEYFERTRGTWFLNAETNIATTCVTYLLFDCFGAGICPHEKEPIEKEIVKVEEDSIDEVEGNDEDEVRDDSEYNESDYEPEKYTRSRLHPFYHYAVYNWGYHVRGNPLESGFLVLSFLRNDAKVASAGRFMYDFDRITGLHLTAEFELANAASELLRNGHDPNCRDENYETPLGYAAERGHKSMVELLLSHPRIDPNYESGIDEVTPLASAVKNGHEEVVQLLLTHPNTNPNSKDWTKRTPLSHAAGQGHREIVQLLLMHPNVDPNSNDDWEQTPLHYAAKDGNLEVVKLLLAQPGVRVNGSNRSFPTPLLEAAGKGHSEVVRLLLAQPGIDVACKDFYGETALDMAKRGKHQEMIQLLEAFSDSSS